MVAAVERKLPVGRWAIGVFGLTTDPAVVADDFGALGAGHKGGELLDWIARSDKRRLRDRAFVETGRTWIAQPFRRIVQGPVTPVEIPVKRYLITHGLGNFIQALFDQGSRYPGGGEGYVAAVQAHQAVWDAVDTGANYLVPAEALGALEQHEQLDDELREDLRLPYRVVNIWFAEPLNIDHEQLTYDLLLGDEGSVIAPDQVEALDPADWVTQLAAMGIAERVLVDGVQLRSDGEGHIVDPFLWFTRVETRFGMAATAIPARRSVALAAGFLELVAAAVAWGRWEGGEDMTAGISDRDLRRELTKGSLRKATRSGRVNPGVRVLDLGASTRSTDSASTGERSVSAHLRRGHWRRVRCGPRTDWHYEYRWVLPTMVGGTATMDPDQVYRLRLPSRAGAPVDESDETTES